MADVKPNPKVQIQRLRMNVANLKATIERQRYELMEMEDRRQKNLENIAITENSIVEMEASLKELIENNEQGGSHNG